TQREAREYDYWAFPRREALHPSIANRKNHKESRAIKNSWAASLDHDWAYWVAKPNVKHLNQYLAAVSWDTDFTVNIGACKLVFFNTGPDRYPDKEDLIWNELAGSGDDWVKDYRNDGSHNRGVLAHHIAMLDEALAGLQDDQLLLIFSHAPFVGLEGNLNGPNDVLFEQDKRRDLRLPNPAEKLIEELYGKTRIELAADGFSLNGTRHFKNGGRDPYLNFGSADGEIGSLFNRIARRKGQSTRRCVFCLAGHSHYVHEFRVERQAQAGAGTGYFYYHDNYADRVFTPTDNAAVLLARYGWQMVNSPILATSGAVKNSTPVYREIVIRGATVKSLQMREIPDRVRTSEFRPGCRLAALRTHDGGYLRAEEGGGTTVTTAGKQAGDYETFELVRMAASSVALRSFRGHYLSWRAAPGVPGLDTMIFADRTAIDDAATFIMGETGDGTVRFRASNDKYVTADATGLHANAPSAGPRETFRLEMLE
ncbi:MAG: hypothetical protein MUE76_07950, partial [Syntrophales bacterium]|nr:hypothetical protein [Syntrophales bacterium]